MPTVEHFVLLIGFALLAIVWWYEDTRLARKCDRCGAAKEPGARWCEPCEEGAPEWLM